MIAQLFVSTFMVLLTVTIHGAGLMGLGRLLRLEEAQKQERHIPAVSLRGLGLTLMLVLALVILHGIEIWAYAFLYLGIGALPDLHTAVYYSTISYSTIGFDDEGFAKAWRLVGAIEGINGIILLGWSTAFFVMMIGRLGRH